MTISILGILTALSLPVFRALINSQSLDKEANIIASFVNKARDNAINSLEFVQHGVVFASSTVTIFYGNNPVNAATSTTYTLESQNSIWNVNFTNGQSYLYFDKLTGKPNTSGTLKVKHGGQTEKIITIYATGLVEVQ